MRGEGKILRRIATPMLFAGGLLLSAPLWAAAGVLTAAQWQKLFEQVPMPPASLAQAGGMIGSVKDQTGTAQLGPTSPALAKSRAALHAGLAAQAAAVAKLGKSQAAAMTGGMTEAQARQLQQKMASASRDEQIQMAMQMAQAQRNAMVINPAAMEAEGKLMGNLQQTNLGHLDVALDKSLPKIMADYDARHAALDAKLTAQLKACPTHVEGCFDVIEPKCLAGVMARFPALIAAHRKLAAEELTRERALILRTRAEMQPGIARTAKLTTEAEGTKATQNQLEPGYSPIIQATASLQAASALATLRAGFWQDIRQSHWEPGNFPSSLYHSSAYGYPFEGYEITAAPTELPKGW